MPSASVRGFVPSGELFANRDMLYLALGILGATVMPHNLYLHSGLVQTRGYGGTAEEKHEAISLATIDSTIALCFAFVINASILILAAATFHRAGKTDIVFAPNAAEMYRPGFATTVSVGGPALGLESDFRPQFFSGVATVVTKLFHQVRPDVAVFGEKDYQQLAVIRAMVRDFDMEIDIVGHPTVREADGLALSSRNAYLSPRERAVAPKLHQALQDVRAAALSGEDAEAAIARAKDALRQAGFGQIAAAPV